MAPQTNQTAQCFIVLAGLLGFEEQFDAAEEAASRAIDLLPEKDNQYLIYKSHCTLGRICMSKGKGEKAIHHFEVAVGIATPFNWHDDLCGVHHELAIIFLCEGRFNDAQAHVEQAKSHLIDNAYALGNTMAM